MNKNYYALLLVTALYMGCANNEDSLLSSSPPGNQSWMVSVQAKSDTIVGLGNDDEGLTRSLYYGGNNGKRHAFIWDVGDKVYVYNGDTPLGFLEPTSTGEEVATLQGTLTGDIAVDDVLSFYLPSRDKDYSGQTGTIASVSSSYMYRTTTTTITAAQTSGSTLSLDDLTFTHAQSYIRIKLLDAATGKRIHPTKVQLFAASGELVKTKALDGTTVYFSDVDPMTINTAEEDGEYPGEIYMAALNDHGVSDTYTLKAWVGEDVYVGPTDKAIPKISNIGVLGNLVRTMTKTTSASTLTVSDIADQTFTGFAIEPAVTVQDGVTTLTLDTDYSVSYTNNTNVGEATATVTGLADAGSVAATKYLGTKDKTFNIVKATPVIDITQTKMTLVKPVTPPAATETRTVTRVFIDNNGNGTWDEGTDYDITDLCTVSYSSTDTGIATVDSSTGEVTPAGIGSTTITASVAAASNWNAQTKTYPVQVSNEGDVPLTSGATFGDNPTVDNSSNPHLTGSGTTFGSNPTVEDIDN